MTFTINEVKVVVGQDRTKRNSEIIGLLTCCSEEIDNIVNSRKSEIDGLISLLEKEGVKTENSFPSVWPRDEWVYHNNRYIVKETGDNFSVGGGILFAKDYVIVSDTLPKSMGYSKEEATEIMKNLYNVKRCHFIPTMKNTDHIDLYQLLLSDVGVIVSDSDYYKLNKKEIDTIAKKEDLTPIIVPNPTSKIIDNLVTKTYPTNSLDIVSESGKLLLYTAKPDGESPLLYALKNYNVQVIEVPFSRILLSGGSVRCKTNFTHIQYDFNAN